MPFQWAQFASDVHDQAVGAWWGRRWSSVRPRTWRNWVSGRSFRRWRCWCRHCTVAPFRWWSVLMEQNGWVKLEVLRGRMFLGSDDKLPRFGVFRITPAILLSPKAWLTSLQFAAIPILSHLLTNSPAEREPSTKTALTFCLLCNITRHIWNSTGDYNLNWTGYCAFKQLWWAHSFVFLCMKIRSASTDCSAS